MSHPRNVYEHIEEVRERLEMYIGDRNISKLEHYLHGYDAALRVHRIDEGDAPHFSQFMWWLLATRPKGGWKCGWAHGLLEREGSNEAALERFFELAAEFGQLKAVEGACVALSPGTERTGAYLALNRYPRAVPERLQVVYLLPGDCAFLRSWFGDRSQDSTVRSSVGSVLGDVEWEYGIAPEAFGITLPEPTGRLAELTERRDRHRQAMEALHKRRSQT